MVTRTQPRVDLLDPGTFEGGQPHEFFRWLRDNAPVFWHPEPDGPGFWAVTRYKDVRTVGKNPKVFSSEPTIVIEDPPEEIDLGDHGMMLTMDPPRHTAYRKLIQREFYPRGASQYRPRIEELASQIVDKVIQDGECDLVTDVIGELPSFVTADLLGVPLEDGRKLYELTETLHASPGLVGKEERTRAITEMFSYASEVREAKLRGPGDDLSSLLAHAELEGETLHPIDFNLFFVLLVDAGGDTTRNLLGGGMLTLFEHKSEWQRLQEDMDGLVSTATEEMLRWVSPVVYMRRTATQDTTLAGQKIAEGDKVAMYFGSANRDEEAFEDPERFDVGRHPNEHIAFGGGGPHFCLGAYLARVEIEVMLRELLTRMPDVEPADEPEWLESTFICGPSHLPVRFSPGRRLG